MNDYRDDIKDKDWERISELLREADCVPEAPDCRSSVMARISRPRPVRRLAWAYGLALAMLAVIAVGTRPFLTHTGDQTSQVAVVGPMKGVPPAPAVKPQTQPDRVALQGSAPRERRRVSHVRHEKPVLVAMATPSETGKMKSATTNSAYGAFKASKADRTVAKVFDATTDGAAPARSVSAGYGMASAAKDKPDLAFGGGHSRVGDPVVTASAPALARGAIAPASSEGAIANGLGTAAAAPEVGRDYYYNASTSRPASRSEDDKRPVAVAVVTWPSGDNSTADSYSYGYTDRNTATGETTECRVKRTGDSVEIYLESKPGPGEPPVKGSSDHETLPNV